MVYKIKKDSHSPFRIPKFHWKKDILKFRFAFTESCKVVSNHINKLYGISYGFHHNNSIRIGWRFNSTHIELYLYTYINSVRKIKHIATIETKTICDCTIKVLPESIELLIGNPLTNRTICFIKTYEAPKIKPGYYLFPYYGGLTEAPQDIEIYLKENPKN